MKRLVPGLALALAALVAACAGERQLPTAPETSSSSHATNAAQSAKGGHKPPKDLSVKLQPDVWNTNYAHSQGTVSALIDGSGIDKIDRSSIVLTGDAGSADPRRVQVSGPHLRAFFGMADAIGVLDHPKRGDVLDVTLSFTLDGEAKTFTLQVRIVGPGDDGGGDDGDDEADLGLEIQPDHWNTNWRHSQGTVTALIRGDGLGQIDLESFELVGTDPAAAPVVALRAKRSGNHVRAFFAQSEAIATLDTPKRGESHEITIRFQGPGGATELTDTILVVGPGQ
jgi:hypothetical protein